MKKILLIQILILLIAICYKYFAFLLNYITFNSFISFILTMISLELIILLQMMTFIKKD